MTSRFVVLHLLLGLILSFDSWMQLNYRLVADLISIGCIVLPGTLWLSTISIACQRTSKMQKAGNE
jgi:hypothetical protein